jgi:hypothetical protein
VRGKGLRWYWFWLGLVMFTDSNLDRIVKLPLRNSAKHSVRCNARNILKSSLLQLSRTSRVVIAETMSPMNLGSVAALLMPYMKLVNFAYENIRGACLV